MASKKITVGADRFLALEWANYAYELFISMGDQATARDSLRMYLEDKLKVKNLVARQLISSIDYGLHQRIHVILYAK